MKIFIYDDYNKLSRAAADAISELVRRKPDALLGLATGSTPIGLYNCLADDCKRGKTSFARVRTVNLDEYVGLSPEHEQSYRRFMNENLFDRIDIDKRNTYVPSGTNEDEVGVFRSVLAVAPIDCQVLAAGANGHIGFNEPADSLILPPHFTDLTPSTIEANARFFANADEVPRRAITMGLGDIFSAKKIIFLLSGPNKEFAARAMLKGDEVTPHIPCTFIRLHSDADVYIDRALAKKIDL